MESVLEGSNEAGTPGGSSAFQSELEVLRRERRFTLGHVRSLPIASGSWPPAWAMASTSAGESAAGGGSIVSQHVHPSQVWVEWAGQGGWGGMGRDRKMLTVLCYVRVGWAKTGRGRVDRDGWGG